MLSKQLHHLLQSRFFAADAARQLWRPLQRLAESPSTDAQLKHRLYVVLAALTYWSDHHFQTSSTGATEEQTLRELTELTNNPMPPKASLGEFADEIALQLQSTFMSTKFHKPPPIAPIFSEARMAVLAQVFPDETLEVPRTSVEYSALLERLRTKLNAGPAVKFVVERKRHHDRKKHRVKKGFFGGYASGFVGGFQTLSGGGGGNAQNRLDSADSMRALYEPQVDAAMRSKPEYAKAVAVLGLLEGRFRTYVERGGVRAEAAQLDKSGLVTTVVGEQDLELDVPTSVFVVLAVLEFSSRKAFTLQSQQQGGLNPALQYILRHALEEHSNKTHWPIVFHVYPNAQTAARLDVDQKRALLDQWTARLPLLARFLQGQWSKGVQKSAGRKMLVPRRGGDVDSGGWNCVAGAWNNALRFVRLLVSELPDHPLYNRTLFKVLKLTAGDQMNWAEVDGKGADADAEVFRELTVSDPDDTENDAASKWLPWDGLFKPVDGLATRIQELCTQHNVPVDKWLGQAHARTSAEIHVHGPMICGVAVSSSVTPAQAQALKEAGFAGAKP